MYRLAALNHILITHCVRPQHSMASCSEQRQANHAPPAARDMSSDVPAVQVTAAWRRGRVDAVVQSTDKNFMVPVGGAVVAAGRRRPGLIAAVNKARMHVTVLLLRSMLPSAHQPLTGQWRHRYHARCTWLALWLCSQPVWWNVPQAPATPRQAYPGRASMAPLLDVLMTLLHARLGRGPGRARGSARLRAQPPGGLRGRRGRARAAHARQPYLAGAHAGHPGPRRARPVLPPARLRAPQRRPRRSGPRRRRRSRGRAGAGAARWAASGCRDRCREAWRGRRPGCWQQERSGGRAGPGAARRAERLRAGGRRCRRIGLAGCWRLRRDRRRSR